jgi:Mg2+/Co2+ transporter CorB
VNRADWAILAVVVVLFIVSIWLAAAETAFVRMSRIRAIALQEEGGRAPHRQGAMV